MREKRMVEVEGEKGWLKEKQLKGGKISVFQAIFENNIKTFEKSLPFLNGKVV